MKARVFEIKRFAVHDGDGIRTTVFLKGCPLRCIWCHNPEGISPSPELAYYAHKCVGCGECAEVCPSGAHAMVNGVHTFDRALCTACGKCAEVCLGNALTLYGKEMTVDELMPRLLEDREFYLNSGGGVTVSGGECLTHADFCRELLSRLNAEGISTAVDTCGFVSREAIDKVLPFTDVFLYDLKAIDSAVHEKCTGRDNKIILENLRYIAKSDALIEIRTPYVPDYNDKEIERIAELLRELGGDISIRILPYHNYAASKYESLGLPCRLPERLPTESEIEEAKEKMRRAGIRLKN